MLIPASNTSRGDSDLVGEAFAQELVMMRLVKASPCPSVCSANALAAHVYQALVWMWESGSEQSDKDLPWGEADLWGERNNKLNKCT